MEGFTLKDYARKDYETERMTVYEVLFCVVVLLITVVITVR